MEILVTLIAAAGCLIVGAIVLNNPPINDPPGMGWRLWTYLTRNVAETRRHHEFPELELRCYRMSPGRLYERVEHAVNVLDWDVVERRPEAYSLHAVVSTQLLKFKDDVTIELKVADCGTELYVRAASRVGRADLAANTRHILTLHAMLDRLL